MPNNRPCLFVGQHASFSRPDKPENHGHPLVTWVFSVNAGQDQGVGKNINMILI